MGALLFYWSAVAVSLLLVLLIEPDRFADRWPDDYDHDYDHD